MPSIDATMRAHPPCRPAARACTRLNGARWRARNFVSIVSSASMPSAPYVVYIHQCRFCRQSNVPTWSLRHRSMQQHEIRRGQSTIKNHVGWSGASHCCVRRRSVCVRCSLVLDRRQGRVVGGIFWRPLRFPRIYWRNRMRFVRPRTHFFFCSQLYQIFFKRETLARTKSSHGTLCPVNVLSNAQVTWWNAGRSKLKATERMR